MFGTKKGKKTEKKDKKDKNNIQLTFNSDLSFYYLVSLHEFSRGFVKIHVSFIPLSISVCFHR